MDRPPAYRIDRSAVVSDVIDGEAVIIHLGTGTYYDLDPAGSVAWSRLQAGAADAGALADAWSARYRADGDALRAAAGALLARLAEEGLVVVAEAVESPPGDDGSAAPGAVEAGTLPAFAPPRLGVHTDMQDFLLVDPIHEVDETGTPRAHRT